MMTKITDQTLFNFCFEYCKAFGQVHDQLRFRNDLALRFYPTDATGLYEWCLERRYFVEDCGNIKFKIYIRKQQKERAWNTK